MVKTKTVRQQLFDYIQQHSLVSVEELSRAMQVTPANIRRHLAILLDQGLIEIAGQRIWGKGRPRRYYQLSDLAAGENLDCLTVAVMDECLQEMNGEGLKILSQHIAHRMLISAIGKIDREREKPASLTRRLNNLIELLNHWHYQARWEARSKAPHLILGHCPYRRVVARQPVLCLIDQYLLEEVLGRGVEQIEKLAADERGITTCVFRIQ